MKLELKNPFRFKAAPMPTENLPMVKPALTRPEYRERGSPGQMIFGGVLRTTDYNMDLQPPYMYDIYDRMRKSDGTVKGLLNAIKLPILNVDWRMRPASSDEQDVAIAAWLQDKLLNDTSTALPAMMYQILLYLDYGSMAFEDVWQIEDNLVSLRKLAPRMPKTIIEWQTDEHGGLRGIKQVAYKASIAEYVEIPIDKLLVYVNDLEGSDYRGNSLLRPCYKHWYMKDRMYILDAIAKERRSIGVDVGTLKGDTTAEDESDLQTALLGLHAHEKQFFIEQEERYAYRIEGLDGRPMPLMDSIDHHDKLILRTLLAEFIGLGGSGGSYAMSRDKSSFFTMALNAIAKNIAGYTNNYLIRRWVDYNWSVTKYPSLEYSRIETRDVVALATSVEKLSAAGWLTFQPDDEISLRDTLELPSKIEGEKEEEEDEV